MAEAPEPTGKRTLTFLLGDVERSTEKLRALGDDYADVLEQHRGMLRDAFSSYGGHAVRTYGDAMFAAFDVVTDAIGAAVAAQLALHRSGLDEQRTFPVRMGLHTGEAMFSGGEYVGLAIHVASRIMDAAHGGQVLVSGATKELFEAEEGAGVDLADTGEHALKDVPEAVRLFQIVHPDLRRDFPPLRTRSSHADNLPQRLTSFVGRARDVERIREMLAEGRILTLTGVGGVGKTRLAIEAGANLREVYPDGVWWVDLAPIAEPALVANALADAVGVREMPTEPIEDSLVRSLEDRRPLVLLDNCEHVIEACVDLCRAMIARCPGITILTTSREPLGVEGESIYRVPSLTVPDEDVAAISDTDSIRLFRERAVAVRPDFEVTTETTPAVARICRRLDGIPLAIELAAARVRMLSVEQIADGLSDRFHLLTGGARTSLPRQRTLEASVDWSYHLLTDVQKTLLARLSVFAGSFGLEAAEEVCSGNGLERHEILDVLADLVDRSLVGVEERGREARYRLLETIRVYARQKLADAGEATDVRDRHLDHYVALAEQAELELQSSNFAVWLDRLDDDLDNLRAAMDWALTSGQVDKNLRIVGAAGLFWMVRARYVEMQQRFEEGLAAEGADPVVRAKALIGAYAVSFTADFNRSNAFAAEAVRLLEESAPDHPLMAAALTILGWTEYWMGREGWREPMEEGVARARRIGHPMLLARCLTLLGGVEAMATRPSAGRSLLEEAARLVEAHSKFYLATTLNFLGQAVLYSGDPREAEGILTRAIETGRAFGHGMFTALPLVGLGLTKVVRGDLDDARERFEEGRQVALDSAAIVAIRAAELGLALVTLAEGEPAAATELLRGALETNRSTGILVSLVTENLVYLGGASRRLGDPRAEGYLTEAVGLAHQYPLGRGQALVELARLALDHGDAEKAEPLAHEALEVLVGAEARIPACDALETLGAVSSALDRLREAARLCGAAQRLREETGYVRFPVDRDAYDAELESLRERLAENEFRAAWSKGTAMLFADVVTLPSP